MRPEEGTAADSAALRERLRHVLWIGGGSGAGKSTVARRIAARHGLQRYATDDVMADHAGRSAPGDRPLLTRFTAMGMDERWVDRTPETMLDTFHWFEGECFDLIVDDLLALPADPHVVVEGFRLLPHLVEPLVAVPRQAVWLLPTPEFRLAVFERRGPSSGFLGRTRDPERALRNLLERDRLFTDRLREEAVRLELPVIDVSSAMTEDELADRVMEGFGL
jgi:2-phosphoglycerate kinase